MKKLFLLFALLAGIAVMTSCQKDQDVVTLNAVIDQDTKAYFGTDHTHLAWWDGADEVFIAGLGNQSAILSNSYPFTSFDETHATIDDVPACSVYCAIFPASAAHTMGTPNASQTKVTIKFPSEQEYIWDQNNNRQRLEMPMGAVATPNANGTTTLQFKNLCSILRVKVKNSLPNSTNIDVKRITVKAYGAYVAGYFDVTLSETGDPVISGESNSDNNVLSLIVPEDATTRYIANTQEESYDIVVPKFDANYLVLEVEVYDHNTGRILGYSSHSIGTVGTNPTVHLGRNKIVPITLEIKNTNLYKPSYAYLECGPDFNRDITALINSHTNLNITTIKFNHQPNTVPRNNGQINSSLVKEVQDANSPYKVYAFIDGDHTITITSESEDAPIIYAHSNCSTMFQGLSSLTSIDWCNNPSDGDAGLQTEDVTNMSKMFYGCENLTNFTGIEYFNTTNVTDMSYMFAGCSIMNGWNLNLSNFNTHNLENMEGMFDGCSGLLVLNLCRNANTTTTLSDIFTTKRVTNMKYLFRGCSMIGTNGIFMDNFNLSNITVDNLSGMCSGLASSEDVTSCNIHCDVNCWNILTQNATTIGIDLDKVHRSTW